MDANPEGEDLEEKKLLGSGGYAFAKLTELLPNISSNRPAETV
jgi:hypothetical protein